jgi:hypothetical protein
MKCGGRSSPPSRVAGGSTCARHSTTPALYVDRYGGVARAGGELVVGEVEYVGLVVPDRGTAVRVEWARHVGEVVPVVVARRPLPAPPRRPGLARLNHLDAEQGLCSVYDGS